MDRETAEEFFIKRFPDRNLKFEKECGYFYEWVERFKTGHPETFMDKESLKVWGEMKKNINKSWLDTEFDIKPLLKN